MTGMKLYADAPARRTRQQVTDVLLVVWIVTWVLIGRAVHGAVLLLGRPGEETTGASNGLAGRLDEAGSAVEGIPLVGDALRSPLNGASDAADQLASAGRDQVEAVAHLAWWLSLAIAAIPILMVLAFYVPRRVHFVRAIGAAQRLVDSTADLDLFALRALANQPLPRLALVSDDPAGAWRRGDTEVVRRLAFLELREVGLRPPFEHSTSENA